jgi:hypothetical protein
MIASLSGTVSATTRLHVVCELERLGGVDETARAKAPRQLEHVPVRNRDAGEHHSPERTQSARLMDFLASCA